MSISSISGQNYFTNTINSKQNYKQQMQTDFVQLGQDLQSGNLTQAQTDYSSIQSLQQSMQSNFQTHNMHHHHGGGVIEALLQELNSDSTASAPNVAQNTSADRSNLQNQNSSPQSQSIQSIESLIAQYMQNMLTGMNAQTQEAGSLNLTNLNLNI